MRHKVNAQNLYDRLIGLGFSGEEIEDLIATHNGVWKEAMNKDNLKDASSFVSDWIESISNSNTEY